MPLSYGIKGTGQHVASKLVWLGPEPFRTGHGSPFPICVYGTFRFTNFYEGTSIDL